MSRFVIGVDGGGSHTRAAVMDEAGQVVGRATGRSALAVAAAPHLAANAVADVCAAAARDAGRSLPVDYVWAGLAGAGRDAARTAVETELNRMVVAARLHVDTDVGVAFHDAFGLGPGILLISGTGSIAWGRAEDGREGRVGGWGHHIGDEGSAFGIGLDALRRAARAADGRGPSTDLGGRIVEQLKLGRVDELVHWVVGASKAQVAELAPVVAKAADEGDAVAQQILARAVEDLDDHVEAIIGMLGPWEHPPTVAMAGGLLRPGRALHDPLVARLGRHRLTLLGRPLDPARGAARLALHALG